MSTNNKCKSKKCGCQDTMLTTPAPCPTPTGCPSPNPCGEIIDAKCVIYTGDILDCNGNVIVAANNNVTEAFNNIIDYVCAETTVSADIECSTDIVVEQGTSVTNALVDIVDYFCNNTPTPGFTYEIGQYVAGEGGVIFHRYKDGSTEHYLVVGLSNASNSATWDNRIGPGQPPMLMNNSTWDGALNFSILVSSTSSQFTSAAYIITFWGASTGKTGWYLPAIDELNLLYNNRFNINRTLSGNSSFGPISGATQIINANYWSSTEHNQTEALFFNFGTAGTYTGAAGSMKTGNLSVRAIRKFSI